MLLLAAHTHINMQGAKMPNCQQLSFIPDASSPGESLQPHSGACLQAAAGAGDMKPSFAKI